MSFFLFPKAKKADERPVICQPDVSTPPTSEEEMSADVTHCAKYLSLGQWGSSWRGNMGKVKYEVGLHQLLDPDAK